MRIRSTQFWVVAAICSLGLTACAGDAAEQPDQQMPPSGSVEANQGVRKGRGATSEFPAAAGDVAAGGAGVETGQGGGSEAVGGAGGSTSGLAGGMEGQARTAGGNGGAAPISNPPSGGQGGELGGTGGTGGTVSIPPNPPEIVDPQPMMPDSAPLLAKVIKTKLLIADVIYVKQIKIGVARIDEMSESKQEKRYESAKNSPDVEQSSVRASVVYAEDIEADEVQAKQVFAQQIQYF